MNTTNFSHWNSQAVLEALRLQLLLKRSAHSLRSCMSNQDFVVGLSQVLKRASGLSQLIDATEEVHDWLFSEQLKPFLSRRDVHEFWGILHSLLLHPERSGVATRRAPSDMNPPRRAVRQPVPGQRGQAPGSRRPMASPRAPQQGSYARQARHLHRGGGTSTPLARMPLASSTSVPPRPTVKPPTHRRDVTPIPQTALARTPVPRSSASRTLASPSSGPRTPVTPISNSTRRSPQTRQPTPAPKGALPYHQAPSQRTSLQTQQREMNGQKAQTNFLNGEFGSFVLPVNATWWKDTSILRALRLRVVRDVELRGFFDLLNEDNFPRQFCFVLREASGMSNCNDAIRHIRDWLASMANRTQTFSTMRVWGHLGPQLLNSIRSVRVHYLREQSSTPSPRYANKLGKPEEPMSNLRLLDSAASADSEESSDQFLAALDEMVGNIASSFFRQ